MSSQYCNTISACQFIEKFSLFFSQKISKYSQLHRNLRNLQEQFGVFFDLQVKYFLSSSETERTLRVNLRNLAYHIDGIIYLWRFVVEARPER